MKKDQLGVVRISLDIINEEPDLVASVLSKLKFVPLRAECMYAYKVIEYEGISDHFSSVSLGSALPHYEINVTRDRVSDDVLKVEAIRSEERQVYIPALLRLEDK